jgi:hypothetical protein
MKMPVLFLLAILTPLLLASALLIPIYGGVLGAAYVMYLPEKGAHPLETHLFDVFYISDIYGKLLDYWLGNMHTLSITEYALPIVGLPVLGVVVALWLSWKIARRLLNTFHLAANIT